MNALFHLKAMVAVRGKALFHSRGSDDVMLDLQKISLLYFVLCSSLLDPDWRLYFIYLFNCSDAIG